MDFLPVFNHCRICMQTAQECGLKNIFLPTYTELLYKIEKLLGFQLSRDVQYSPYVCNDCFVNMNIVLKLLNLWTIILRRTSTNMENLETGRTMESSNEIELLASGTDALITEVLVNPNQEELAMNAVSALDQLDITDIPYEDVTQPIGNEGNSYVDLKKESYLQPNSNQSKSECIAINMAQASMVTFKENEKTGHVIQRRVPRTPNSNNDQIDQCAKLALKKMQQTSHFIQLHNNVYQNSYLSQNSRISFMEIQENRQLEKTRNMQIKQNSIPLLDKVGPIINQKKENSYYQQQKYIKTEKLADPADIYMPTEQSIQTIDIISKLRKEATGNSDIKRIKNSKTETESFPCKYCSRRFDSKRRRGAHLRVHIRKGKPRTMN